ncbi:hypothetical protein KY290_035810 [Solanum tuberosum]|uniref:Uncharacterized protein n=1 Tax=Solanum tuberosum TaxID=4113 RepID=A0ABQ7TUK2_SOLTU|nr:hypothetical protein KY284_035175 [Solanum tuberosum]KAH0737105.1 hypothetical protein KY290_035810 [Solanum tuberosum]
MANSHAKNVPPPPPPVQSPPPTSPAHSPPYVRKEATQTADIEILGVYGSSALIHSVNSPPKKRGSMLNAGEGKYVVWEKRPNVEAFGATTSDALALRSLEFSSVVSGSNDGEHNDQSESPSQSGTYELTSV